MNHDKIQKFPSRNYVSEEDEINLVELILVLAKHKRMIFSFCLATFVMALGISLLMPDIYSATARILPSQKQSEELFDAETYVSMLKSQAVSDAIIDRFELVGVHQKNSRSEIYERLNSQVSISAGKKDQIIQVKIEGKDPNRVAGVANAYVEELQKLLEKKHFDKVSTLQQVFEKRLKAVRESLVQAEQKLKAFQVKKELLGLVNPTKSIIQENDGIEGVSTAEWGEIEVVLPPNGDKNLQVAKLRGTEGATDNQIWELNQRPAGQNDLGDMSVASSAMPKMDLQYAKLLRDFRVQERLLELLTQQQELARIEGLKSVPALQVLDTASVPAKKSKPKRMLIVMLATFCAGFFAILVAFVLEYIAIMSDEDRNTWQQVKGQFKFRH